MVVGSLETHIMEHLAIKDIRPSTRQTYLRTLRPFMDMNLEGLNLTDINEVLLSINNQNTRRKTVITLKACIDHPAVRALRIPESVPKVYDLPSETTLRLALMTCPHQTRALLMMYAGLRIGEACAVTGKDLQGNLLFITKQKDGYNHQIRPTKTGSDAIPIPDWLVPQVQALGDCEVSVKGVRKALLNAGKRVGIHLNPHQLRHWYATNLIKRGVPPQMVQRLMRHKNIRTTFSIYAQVGKADLYEAVKDMGDVY